MNMKDKSVWL